MSDPLTTLGAPERAATRPVVKFGPSARDPLSIVLADGTEVADRLPISRISASINQDGLAEVDVQLVDVRTIVVTDGCEAPRSAVIRALQSVVDADSPDDAIAAANDLRAALTAPSETAPGGSPE